MHPDAAAEAEAELLRQDRGGTTRLGAGAMWNTPKIPLAMVNVRNSSAVMLPPPPHDAHCRRQCHLLCAPLVRAPFHPHLFHNQARPLEPLID